MRGSDDLKIYNDLTELIGSTPLVELNKIKEIYGLDARLVAKLEYFNPAGSIKDRIGYGMIVDAEKKGLIKPGDTLIEPTAGNTGIGLAFVAAIKGYRLILTMSETMSEERQKLLKAYGAEVVLTPGHLGMNGSIAKAEELLKEIPNSYIPQQFKNPANPLAQREAGSEIWADTDGEVDLFVACVGSGGTITGIGEYLKEKNPNVKIAAVEPEKSPVLSGGLPAPHGIQGIGPGFISEITNVDIFDEIISVKEEEAYDMSRVLAKEEGLLVGISSGAALSAAVKLVEKEEYKGKMIVVLLADGGEKYLSTELFSV